MKQILDKVNEIAEVLNDTNGVANVEWVKNNVNELQELVKEKCNLPVVIARFSDETIDGIIHELNEYGHEYDHYEFGLPTYDQHMDNMRNIVKVKLNGL